jgi:3-mercaptopyruvate sulfurtransferase SseA
MANKRRHESPSSNNTPLIILAAAGLLVAALVGWALTREVQRPAVGVVEPPVAEMPATTTVPVTTAEPVPARRPDEDESTVPRIAAEDLRAKHNRGEVLVVDVRDARGFATGHIPGAINIPFPTVEGAAGTLPRNRPIVTYCT